MWFARSSDRVTHKLVSSTTFLLQKSGEVRLGSKAANAGGHSGKMMLDPQDSRF
jgi:hypothetical protein